MNSSDTPATSQAREPALSANSNLRDLAVCEISTLFTEQLDRRDDECRHAIESVKKKLAALELTCEAALDKLAEQQCQPSTAVAGVVDRLVAAAVTEAESVAQKTRAAAQIEIGRLQALVDRTQTELADERARLKMAREQAQRIVTDLAGQLQSLQEKLKAERAEMSGLKQRLETEHTERAKLSAALQTVQRAVSFADPVGARPDLTLGPQEGAAVGNRTSPDSERHVEGEGTEVPPVGRPLKLVANARASAESHPELLEYVQQLLAEMESIYWADLRTEGNAADVVDRLTANLRYAHDVFTRRLATSGVDDATLFERQMAILLDSKPETSFARHLAIAAYEYSLTQTTAAQPRAEAS